MNDKDDVLKRASAFLSRSRGIAGRDYPILTESIASDHRVGTPAISDLSAPTGQSAEHSTFRNPENPDENYARLCRHISTAILDQLQSEKSLLLETILNRVENVLKQEIEDAISEALFARIPEMVRQAIADLPKSDPDLPPPLGRK